MKVVVNAMMTNMEKIRADRMPSSYPILSAINSINPRVFIKAPSRKDSIQFMPVQYAIKEVPPNLPTVAIKIMPAHKQRLTGSFSSSTWTRRPVKAKKMGNKKVEVKLSMRT